MYANQHDMKMQSDYVTMHLTFSELNFYITLVQY